MEAKIKPCPFCGGEPGIVQSGIHKNWIRCTRCKAKIGGTSESIFDAIERWNTRIPTDAESIRSEVERKLKEANTRDGPLYKSDVDDRGEG